MRERPTYHHLLLAIFLIVLLSLVIVPAAAQDCSRNMLTLTAPNSYIVTPSVSALNLTHGFTIECWARAQALRNGAALVDKFSYGIYLRTDSTVSGSIRHSNQFLTTSPPIDSIGLWHHYAFVFTPNDSIRLYIDSIEVANEKSPVTSLDSNSDSIRIGISISGTQFFGSIDELRIWNIPRSLQQIEQTLTKTLAGNDSSLVLYYPFDDPVGSTRIHDFSGHRHDGFFRGSGVMLTSSTSPVQTGVQGFALTTVEQRIIIPTMRCTQAFDTIVQVRNLGTVPIVVDTVGFRFGAAYSVIPTDTSFTLPPDSTRIDSLRIRFAPPRGGIFDDSLYIATSSFCGGRVLIGVHAAYDSVGLHTSPSTINFGLVSPCKLPITKSVVVTNASLTDSVTITDVEVPSGIQVLTPFPIHLAAQQDTTVLMQLLPGPPGAFSAALQFDLDKCSSTVSVNVTGNRASVKLGIPSIIDLGTAPAQLNGITRDTTILVTNIGDVPNGIAAIGTSDTAVLQILDGRQGVLRSPGDTLQVHLRIHATGCGTLSPYLKLKTLICPTDTSSTILMYLTSPLPLTVQNLHVQGSCQPTDTSISILNPNSTPLVVDTITFSTNGVFTIPPIIPFTVPPHTAANVPVEFIPSQTGSYVDTVYFETSPCGTGIAVLSGTMGFEGLAFSSPQLLMGRGCIQDTVQAFDTLVNKSADTVTISSNSYSGSPRFSIVPFSLPVVLAPGTSQVFSVTYFSALGSIDIGQFSFLTASGCDVASFSFRGSREKAKAQWTSNSGAFDTVCPGAIVTKRFSLIDKGIDTIDVQNVSVTGTGFSLLSAASKFRDTGIFTVAFAPTQEQSYNGNLIITADNCGTSFALPLTGSGGPTPQLIVTDSLISFDSVLVGDSESNCIELTNPSCTPITVSLNSVSLSSPFHWNDTVTLTLSRGDTATLCLEFQPGTYGSFSDSLSFKFDSISTSLQLRGTGLAPDIRFAPHTLDFGYVLVDSSKTLTLYDTNRGNIGAFPTLGHSNSDFSVPNSSFIPAASIDSIAVAFTPTVLGRDTDILQLTWNGRTDTILLFGVGAKSGLQADHSILNFGNVHIGTDSTLALDLFATNNFPTIDSISISGTVAIFPFQSSHSLPYSLTALQDSDSVFVTYHAQNEQHDSSDLIIYAGIDSLVIPLIGNGVEAHPVLNPPSFNFGSLWIDSSEHFYPLRIKDTGGYPLFIDSIYSSDPAFSASPISAKIPLLPDSVFGDTITFTPYAARYYSGTISFRTSYHDSTITLNVSGRGIYPTGAGPSFGFSVASRPEEEPGQIDTIPITLIGSRLSRFDTSSITLNIGFDPLMVRILGAEDAFGANTNLSLVNDSTVEFSAPLRDTNTGIIASLFTEALLGPHDTSYIHVLNSSPIFTQAESASDGLFAEVDCGGPVHGVIFKGPNSTSAIVPNPASDNATVQFQSGFDGAVSIEVYNSIGQSVKHIAFGDMSAGTHALKLDVSDLPAGSYVYRLTSLEYRSEGALSIVR